MQQVTPKRCGIKLTYCLDLQGGRISSFLRTKAGGSSETSVNTYHAERCDIPGDNNVHIHRHDDITSHVRILDLCNCVLHEGIVKKFANHDKNQSLTANVSCPYSFLLMCHFWRFDYEIFLNTPIKFSMSVSLPLSM